jgi:hypothetical protein
MEVALTTGTSLFLFAVGAILRFAVTWTLAGICTSTVSS